MARLFMLFFVLRNLENWDARSSAEIIILFHFFPPIIISSILNYDLMKSELLSKEQLAHCETLLDNIVFFKIILYLLCNLIFSIE